MEHTLLIVLIGTLITFFALYLLWKLLYGLDRMHRRRESKRREDADRISICRWGFDADGEMYRVRVRLPRED